MPKAPMLKKEILKHALILFTEKSYSEISLRDIAKAAGTTIGNVSYHFHKKEDLLIEILNEFHINDCSPLLHIEADSNLIACLCESFRNVEKLNLDWPFYYQNILELGNASDAIKKSGDTFRLHLYSYYLNLFCQLQDHGYMRTDLPQQVYENLSYTLIVCMTSWYKIITTYQNIPLKDQSLCNAMMNLVVPYLTQSGLKEYSEMGLT